MENYQFKPFEQVLVREDDNSLWKCQIYSHILIKSDKPYYVCMGHLYGQCIPYKGNEHYYRTKNKYVAPQPKTYHVEWGMDSQMEQQDYTDEEFKNFIKTAVLRNKDISNFKVTRICG